MPELPEVETTRRGLESLLVGKEVREIRVHQPQLRYPVPEELGILLVGQKLVEISRRAKYLILKFNQSNIIIHLGMSGSLCVVNADCQRAKHDHIELFFTGGEVLRYHDPRRFGSWQYFGPGAELPFKHFGPEPLSSDFDTSYFFDKTRRVSAPIKQAIMNQKLVVGVGNIYACEALFRAKIHPQQRSSDLNYSETDALVNAIKYILTKAIAIGGTTLKDFRNPNNNPGYFAQELMVYGRGEGECRECEAKISKITLGQRSTFFCSNCQQMT